MLIIGFVLAALAALLHVYIFVLESLLWTTRTARSVFRTSAQEAEQTRALAFNQGFYNLFLALLVIVGLLVHLTGSAVVGLTLVLAGITPMLAAALVLGLSSRAHRSAAITQGTLPLLAVVAVVASLLL